jgi:uncharacterized damage-inducible protein DinB
MLEGWLDYHRALLPAKCAGLDDEQRKHRPVATSLMSLHGLVRHLAEVERNWFGRVLRRQPGMPALFLTEAATGADWAPLEAADWAPDLAAWQAECAAARQEAAAHSLDEVFTGRRGGRLVACSLRWIYNHMIEEYAQHNGHADLIRELIDGRVSS